MKILIFHTLLIFLNLTSARNRKTEETEYQVNFLDVIRNCDDFKNEHFSLTELEMIREGDSTWLTGNIHIYKDIVDGTNVSLTVYKTDEITGVAMLFYNIEESLCDSCEEKDKPWTILSDDLGVNSCPIKAGIYKLERFSLNVDYAKEYMRHEYIGIYLTKLVLLSAGKGLDLVSNLSCHLIDTEISL